MRKFIVVCAVACMFLAVNAQAVVSTGSWDSSAGPLLGGTWDELYGLGGPGSPGSVVSGGEIISDQWFIGELYIPEGGGPNPPGGVDNGDGTVTYTTFYTTDLTASGWGDPSFGLPSYLDLAEEAAMWGDACTFELVDATVVATINQTDGSYVSGSVTGSGGGVANAAGLTASFYGELERVYADTYGHGGDVTYLELEISGTSVVPVPSAILLGSIGTCIVGWFRRRS